MPLVGSFIFPHGALALSKVNVPQKAHQVHDGCMAAAEQIYNLKPDIIFLTTPHGVSLDEAYVLYGNAKAAGTAEWAGEWKEYGCEVDIAQDVSRDLYKHLSSSKYEQDVKFEMVTSFAESETIALRWGEAIPIWFIQQKTKAPEFVFFAMPRKRMDRAKEMIPELIQIGKNVADFFASRKERVVYVVSGDLAHTHKNEYQPELQPFGVIDEDAKKMDGALESWVTTLDEKHLHNEASKYLNTAVCGFTGFVQLSGSIAQNGVDSVTPTLLCPATHATYYGMMVASFLPKTPVPVDPNFKRTKAPPNPYPVIG